MNQQQKTYLSKRIEQITLQKIQQNTNVVDIKPYLKRLRIQNHFGFIKSLKYNEKVTGIKNKCLECNRFPNDNQYNDVFDTPESIVFSNYEEIKKLYDNAVKVSDKSDQKKHNEIRVYSQKLQDEVMLGDAQEALKQLSEFEKKVF